MTREEMIAKLQTLSFAYVDYLPDTGFTERPLWVNEKGYGYLSCDDPSDRCWDGAGMDLEKWTLIRKLIATRTLKLEDLEGTSLVSLLDEMFYDGFFEDEDPCEYLEELLTLPEGPIDHIYCMSTIEGLQFFSNEEDFKKAYERDWCDCEWEELDDNILEKCIEQLTDEGLLRGEYVVVCPTDDLDIDFQEFIDTLDDYFLDTSVESADIEAYLEEARASLKEYITENHSDVFYEILWDLYAVGKSNGNISYYEAYDNLIDETKENIHQKYGDVYIELLVRKANDAVKASCSVLAEDILVEFLDSETECGEFDAKVGKYVESSLRKFLDSATWHLGYRQQDGTYAEIRNATENANILDKSCPIIWFGLDGEPPIDKWSIVPGVEHGFKWIDQWDLLEYLIDDCTDCFSTWYLAECGYDLPDMEAILATCPICISENDDSEILNEKVSEYFRTLK